MRVGSIGSAAHSRALRPLHDHRARRVGPRHRRGHRLGAQCGLTGVFGFVAAACIWWLYFDHVGSAGLELGPRTAFYWGYGHLAVYAGIAAFGVGVQLAIEGAATAEELASVAAPQPAGERGVVSGARAIFGGSVALYLAAISFIHWVNEHTLDDRIVLVRLIAAVTAVGLAFFGSALSPPLFVASVALLLLALTTFESLQAGETLPR